MHAYLIVSQGEKEREMGVQKILEDLNAKPLTFTLSKIADVREMAKFTKLKLSEKTAVVVQNIDEATIDAQNAFLKPLEEPQKNLIYILTASSIDLVLPTIASRCEVVELKSEGFILRDEIVEVCRQFMDGEAGERMKIISKITKRDEAITFIEGLITIGHKSFLTKPELGQFLEEAGKTLKALKANGNVQLQLTNFVVNLD